MAPICEHATVTVLSTEVRSYDGKSILVEAGGFTPARWFLERGVSDEGDAEEPPKKRRKTSGNLKVNRNDKTTYSATAGISLSRVILDLHFPETLLGKPPSESNIKDDVAFADGDGPAVITTGFEQDQSSLRFRVAHPTYHGAVLVVEAAALQPAVLEALRSVALPSRQKATYNGTTSDRPASIYKCTLTRSTGTRYTTLRLEATVAWRDGASAFPSGVPVGKTRLYSDYELLVQAYPNAARDEINHAKPWSPQEFYDGVHIPDASVDTLGQYESVLDSELYPFQKRAVRWMLVREGVECRDGSIAKIARKDCDVLRFYEAVKDNCGQTCYVDHLRGTISRNRPLDGSSSLSGGLLAEEMGLGKTVEVMALVSLHKRCDMPGGKIDDPETGTRIRPSKATLIITPPSILQQWQSELARHAPALKVLRYEGIPTGSKKDRKEKDLLDDLASKYDVVLATYSTIGRELHYAEAPPERDMRHVRKFERKRSPLVQIQWWRICLDEAQMVESGVTTAARVACRLPRVHSWAVTGTPLRKNVQDLHGLLIFLRLKPLSESARLWSHLIANHRHLFRRIFGAIALRHTKAQIRDELRLPCQKRVVVTLPFTAVEQQHYGTLFEEMCQDVGLTSDGTPVKDSWDPENTATVETMRTWLVRLRQTCLHPQVGGRNRRALGRGQGPLRTVAEVLSVMIEQNEVAIRVEERVTIASQLLRGHILGNDRGNEHRSKNALDIYNLAMARSEVLVREARQRLDAAKSAKMIVDGTNTETEDEETSSESAPLLGRLRNGLRDALQLQHACTFFAATACYQIKSNEALTPPASDHFKELEEHEAKLYEVAKVLRKEILLDVSRKADSLMSKNRELQQSGTLSQMPKIKNLDSLGGIESRRITEKADELFDIIRAQSKVLGELRERTVELLLKPLVDKDDLDNEMTGEEYEESRKQQDELFVYFDAVKATQADIYAFVTGGSTYLTDVEVESLIKSAKTKLDPKVPDELKPTCQAPELILKLFLVRNKFVSKKKDIGTIRGLTQEARQLEGSMQSAGSSARAGAELAIVQRHIAALHAVFTSYTKALSGLEEEVDLFRSTQNHRLEFYRQLQELSDAVAPHKEELDEELDFVALQEAVAKEGRQNAALAQLKTKQRFLLHLKEENDMGKQSGPRICVICQGPFENGVLTVCGHQYCKECIQHWWQQHRTCPVCKRRLALVDFHNITYKPQELRAQREEVRSEASSSSNGSPEQTSIPRNSATSLYSDVDVTLMEAIKSIDLPSSYGTKIDTLARHLLWIREHDPGAKSIVFSQYREFLDVLGSAFQDFKVGYSRLGRSGAVEKFRHDASIDCLLLDAKTDSSGLTLVNATHVLICEPLIQTAVEIQAIARVHRIGQTRPTTVWMYLVNDTVEESIYEISVSRRLAHVQTRQRQQQQLSNVNEKSRSAAPAPLQEQALDAANSEELQGAPMSKLLVAGKGGGEVVGKDDLWRCLFGKRQGRVVDAVVGENIEREMGRRLRGDAVGSRVADMVVGR